jgi:hypothetical protein
MARFRTVTDQAKEELLKRLRRRHGSKLNRYLVSIGVGRNCLRRWKNGDPMSVRSFYDICDRSKILPTRLLAKVDTLSDKYDLMQQDFRESRDPDERHAICVMAASTLYGDLVRSFERICRISLACDRAEGRYPNSLNLKMDLNGGSPIKFPPVHLKVATKSQDMIWLEFKNETRGILVEVTEFARGGYYREIVLTEPLGLATIEEIFKKFRNINSLRPRRTEIDMGILPREKFEAPFMNR